MTPTLADEIEALAQAIERAKANPPEPSYHIDGGERSRAFDSYVHDLMAAVVLKIPAIVSALREVSALKEEVERLRGAVSHADRCERFVKLVASQRLSEQAVNWYLDEFGDEGGPDFEGAYDAFIEQARSIINDRRAALGGGG